MEEEKERQEERWERNADEMKKAVGELKVD